MVLDIALTVRLSKVFDDVKKKQINRLKKAFNQIYIYYYFLT